MKKRSVMYLLALVLIVLPLMQATARGNSGDSKAIAGLVFQEDQFFRFVKLGMEETTKEAGYEFLGGNM